MAGPAEDLRTEYDNYDHLVDIVSAAEVWFTKSRDLTPTVAHFERFPRFNHSDGQVVTPEFTVLFNDGTGLVGEISSLALRSESLDSLASQVGRYDTLEELPSGAAPGGGHTLEPISAVDVVVFVPHRVANACIDRLAAAAADDEHPFDPQRLPMVLSWSFDQTENSYTFARDERGGKNPMVRSHGRSPSLSDWLAATSDTLRGVPGQFVPVKVARRFMNDDPPELYTATVLWAETIPSLLGTEADGSLKKKLDVSAAELAEAMRDRYGFGTAGYADKVLRFLRRAGLAVKRGERWIIDYREISRSAPDLRDALLARATSKRRSRATTTVEESEDEPSSPAETLLSESDTLDG